MPILAKHFSKNEVSDYVKSFEEIYQMGFIFLAFVIVFTIGASEPIIKILYHSNNISNLDLDKIIILSKYYSVCLIGIFLYTIFGMSMVATLQNKYYAIYVIVTQFIVIILNFTLLKTLGIYVFPIVFAFGHLIGAFLMFKKFPYPNTSIIKISIKYMLYILITSLIMIITNKIITFQNNYLNIIYLGILQIVIMILTMYFMKIEEFAISIKKIKEFTNKINIK
jgi:peptidoglycan biosynthesis protein MviN/MurJ (putative lipid II flippase)